MRYDYYVSHREEERAKAAALADKELSFVTPAAVEGVGARAGRRASDSDDSGGIEDMLAARLESAGG